MEKHSIEMITRALNDHQVKYLIAGGLAVWLTAMFGSLRIKILSWQWTDRISWPRLPRSQR
jgi:hypothetical protein